MLLVWVGVVDVKYLKKVRPYVVIGCFSQTLLAVPMWLLFEVGVLCSSLIRMRGETAPE